MSAVLVDTNVLVYAYDESEPVKAELAEAVITSLVKRREAVITTQCLAEFFSVLTHKFGRRASPDTAQAGLERYAATMRVLDMRVPVVFEAARGVRRYGLSYYDAQIWASARLAGIELVLSEDFASGTEIEGVRFLDPFAEGFSLADALASGDR
jgi:predicted nucleic acid-binding protein